MPLNSNDYALVVGIEHYPGFRPLKGAINDAKVFAEWLVDAEIGGALPIENCKLVLSTESPLVPIQDDIDQKLQEIFDAIGGGQARRLYLFFSGHGLARSNTDTDLCLAKWSQSWRNMALDSRDNLELVMASGRFREVAFFLDCCRLRLVRAKGRGPGIDIPKPADNAGMCRSFIANATEFQNAAYEAEVSDTLDINGPQIRGHFTRALMAALRGGAAQASGGVRASRLKEYLEAETPRIAREAGHQQRPEIVNGLPTETEDMKEPIFGLAPPNTDDVDVEIIFNPERQGPIVLIGPNNQELKRGNPSTAPWHLRLEPKLHLLIDEGTGMEKNLRFTGAERMIQIVF